MGISHDPSDERCPWYHPRDAVRHDLPDRAWRAHRDPPDLHDLRAADHLPAEAGAGARAAAGGLQEAGVRDQDCHLPVHGAGDGGADLPVQVPVQTMEDVQYRYQVPVQTFEEVAVQVPKTVMVPQTTYETVMQKVPKTTYEVKTATQQVPRMTY